MTRRYGPCDGSGLGTQPTTLRSSPSGGEGRVGKRRDRLQVAIEQHHGDESEVLADRALHPGAAAEFDQDQVADPDGEVGIRPAGTEDDGVHGWA